MNWLCKLGFHRWQVFYLWQIDVELSICRRCKERRWRLYIPPWPF